MTTLGLGLGAAAAYLGLTGKVSKLATAVIGTGCLTTTTAGTLFASRGCRQAKQERQLSNYI